MSEHLCIHNFQVVKLKYFSNCSLTKIYSKRMGMYNPMLVFIFSWMKFMIHSRQEFKIELKDFFYNQSYL